MMRPWVIPFLRERGDPRISPEQLDWELAVPMFAFRRLARCLTIITPRGYDRHRLLWLIGCVVGHVPEDVFQTLLGLNTIFICFNSLAAVNRTDRAAVQITLHGLLELTDSEAQGALVHEVGHVIGGEVFGTLDIAENEMEQRADDLAEAWGFADEISAIRNYYSRERRESHGREFETV